MVEGGAQIISSFMQEDVVDALIVTVAPTMVGEAGIGYGFAGSSPDSVVEFQSLQHVYTGVFGKDSVVAFCTDGTKGG